MACEPITDKFVQSQEAVWRRFVRQSIRNAPLTRAERDVLMALANFWFHHKGRGNALIYPGRKKLAYRAKVSIITVARCLKKFREAGVLTVASHPKGGWGTSTHYAFNQPAMFELCGYSLPHQIQGGLVLLSGQNDTHSQSEMIHTPSIKMIHEYNNVWSHLFQGQENPFVSQPLVFEILDGEAR